MIVRTEAVVLRAMDYGETSRIVALFSRERGRLSVMAKGARLTRSRFGSMLQPGSHIQAVFYYKPSRGLQLLSEAAHLESYHQTGRSLEKLTLSLRVLELVHALLPEEEPHPVVFNLLLQVLDRINTADERLANLLPYFQLRLASILGFAPDFDKARVEALPPEGGTLVLSTGGIFTDAAPGTALRRASRAALRAFAICSRAHLDAVMQMLLSPAVRDELDGLIEAFLRFHIDEGYPSRSARVASQLLSKTRL